MAIIEKIFTMRVVSSGVEKEIIPAVILSEYGPYSCDTLEAAKMALRQAAEGMPWFDWDRRGKVIFMLYTIKSGMNPPERLKLPSGAVVIYWDVRKKDIPHTLKEYVDFMDVGLKALQRGCCPEEAAAQTLAYAREVHFFEELVLRHDAHAKLTETMQLIRDDLGLGETEGEGKDNE